MRSLRAKRERITGRQAIGDTVQDQLEFAFDDETRFLAEMLAGALAATARRARYFQSLHVPSLSGSWAVPPFGSRSVRDRFHR
jgi:hypothetical protein